MKQHQEARELIDLTCFVLVEKTSDFPPRCAPLQHNRLAQRFAETSQTELRETGITEKQSEKLNFKLKNIFLKREKSEACDKYTIIKIKQTKIFNSV